ncbi:CROL alpha [Diplogelasinospora grovesii]|uniref:CROL alpha n=1 Tax=Diplogelasinospora grovesii TaxID=303347 RepID=A0AAN6NEB1_9PEZI|nr:CROL alpha [Diplogelasinospora grovesii]
MVGGLLPMGWLSGVEASDLQPSMSMPDEQLSISPQGLQPGPECIQAKIATPQPSSSGDQDPDRPHICLQCNSAFKEVLYLEWHARDYNHRAFPCGLPSCDEVFVSRGDRDAHQCLPHLEDHARIHPDQPFACIECNKVYRNRGQLQDHANESQHSPFACKCGAKFARVDVLNRHLESLGTDIPKHPCPYCKSRRGKNGFRRRDHLIQHIRGYHKLDADEKLAELGTRRTRKYEVLVCPHAECEFHRDGAFLRLELAEKAQHKPFVNKSDYTKHMRDVHKETPFPCDVPGCDKTGAKGYFLEKALMRHRDEKHPDAPKYTPETRNMRKDCPLGCGVSLAQSAIYTHVEWSCKRRTAVN